MKRKTICDTVQYMKDYIRLYYESGEIAIDFYNCIKKDLELIKLSAQHMENRLHKYRKSIECLGFKRDKRIKSKIYKDK